MWHCIPWVSKCLASPWHLTFDFLLEVILQSVHCHIPSAVLAMYWEIKSSKSEQNFKMIVISRLWVQTPQLSCVFSCGSSRHFCLDKIYHKLNKKTLVWQDGLTQHDSWHYFSFWIHNHILGNNNYHQLSFLSSVVVNLTKK